MSSQTLIAKSSVETENHEKIENWKIENFRVLTNQNSLNLPTFPFTIGSSTDKVSKWKLFFSREGKFSWSNRTELLFKLEEYTGPDAISVALNIRIETEANVKFEYKFDVRNFTKDCKDPVKCNFFRYRKFNDGWRVNHFDYGGRPTVFTFDSMLPHLRGQTLTLFVNFKIFGKCSLTISPTYLLSPTIKASEQEKSTQRHKEVMLAMLESGESSDMTFQTKDDQVVAAHRFVLIMQSTVFAAMFATEMKEKTDGVVKLTDMGADGLKIFLKFLYCGELDDKWIEFYEEIINAAVKYQITRLVEMCEKLLPTLVNWENCVELLELAELHEMARAEEMIKEFMKGDPEKCLQLWFDEPPLKRRRLA